MGSPLASGQHGRLVVLLDQGSALLVAAHVLHKAVLGVVLQALPLQHLHRSAMRTRDVVVPLVALGEEVGDPRNAFQRGRAGVVELRAAAERRTARLGLLDRVAVVVDVHFPAIDFVAVHVPSGQLGQVGGRAG